MKKKKNLYFGEVEEKAVVRYIKTESSQERHDIYNNILREPFNKMVSSILRKYNNHIGNYDILNVEADGLTHLLENMVKFRPYIIEYKEINNDEGKWIRHKKYKFLDENEMYSMLDELNNNDDDKYEYRPLYASAYSYCGTIVRNYFKDHSKNSRKEILCNIELNSAGINFDEDENYAYYESFMENEDPVLLVFDNIIENLEEILDMNDNLNKNEIIVGKAIVNILKNWEDLFKEQTENGVYDKAVSNNFTKSKIFLLLKEYTRMDIKEIRQSMKPYNPVYQFLKKKFNLH